MTEPGCAALDGDLEREQVGLAVRGRIDERVEPVAVGLVAVQREVLDRRDHALALDPGDRLAGEHAAEQRVLGQVLEVAPVARVAREVDAAGEHHVEAAAARLAADHRARGARQRRVEARAQGDARRQRGRGVARPVARVGDAEARVAHQQRRDAEALARPGRSPRSSGRRRGCARRGRGGTRWSPMTLTRSEKRSSSVICASVSRARSSGVTARLLPARARGELASPAPLCDGPHSAPVAAVRRWRPFVIAG